ncbi:MAG: GTP cyclohydrolase I FolE [Nocardioides sp.]
MSQATSAPEREDGPRRTWRPRIVHQQPTPDPAAVERASAALLEALGLDTREDGLAETPRRMASAYLELLTVPEFELTTFPNDGYDELVLVRDIQLRSVCEHHLLPFVGVAHVGYLPGHRIAGLSKLARMVDFHARRPQTQERLTQQIADHLSRQLEPRGVGVLISAEHTCMSLRGVRAVGAHTLTSALYGQLREDPASRAEFLALARPEGGSR